MEQEKNNKSNREDKKINHIDDNKDDSNNKAELLIPLVILFIVFMLGLIIYYFSDGNNNYVKEKNIDIVEKSESSNIKHCDNFFDSSISSQIIPLPIECDMNRLGEDFKDWYFKIFQNDDNESVVEILDNDKNIINNIVIDENFLTNEISSHNFQISEDINFDGYNDIRIIKTSGASNMQFEYLNYNLNTREWDRNYLVATNPSFYPDNRIIEEFILISYNESITTVYEFTGDKYEISSKKRIRKVEDFINDDDFDIVEYIIKGTGFEYVYGEDYAVARERVISNGWEVVIPENYIDNSRSTELDDGIDEQYPEISRCGSGSDFICNVDFIKNDEYRHFNLRSAKLGTTKSGWIVVGTK